MISQHHGPVTCLHTQHSQTLSHGLLTRRLRSAQTYEDIVKILKTYRNPKGIKCAVKPALWGEHYAASAGSEKIKGVIDRWKDTSRDGLMIKWDGYNRCQTAPLTALENDEHSARRR